MTLSSAFMSLAPRSPDLDPGLQAQPRQCWVREKDHLSASAGVVMPNGVQDTTGRLCSKGTFLALVLPGVHQDSQVLFCQAASSWVAPTCTGAWSCSFPSAGLCILPWWISWGNFTAPQLWFMKTSQHLNKGFTFSYGVFNKGTLHGYRPIYSFLLRLP